MAREPKSERSPSRARPAAIGEPVGPEKRRQPRFDSDQRLWCEGQPDPRAILALNMSLGGMFIVGDEAHVGEELQVSFSDGGEVICLDLEVVWKGPARAGGPEGAGTRIVGFSAGRDIYDRFVQRKLQHQDPATRDHESVEDRAEQPEEERSRSRPA